MFFRNATLYRFGPEVAQRLYTFEERIALFPLRNPGPVELATRGFLPIWKTGEGEPPLVRWCGNSALFCFGERARMLPPDVVAEDTARRVDAVLAKEGRRVGHKERRRMREEVISELLPRAFVRQTRTYAYLDLDGGWLVIDTASRNVAEAVIHQLREAMSQPPCTPLTPEESPRVLMTDWLVRGNVPKDLALGEECDLADPAEAGAKWTGRRADLESEDVREHLRSGMQVLRLGLTYAARLSFVLGEDLVLRKLRFLDSALDDLSEDSAESAEAELDARFALMRLEFERLFAVLSATLGIPREGKLVLDGGDAPTHMRDVAAPTAPADFIVDLKGADELLPEAITIVRLTKRASISSLQRALKIGYNRAARLIEAMEELQIVSLPDASGARTVLLLGAL